MLLKILFCCLQNLGSKILKDPLCHRKKKGHGLKKNEHFPPMKYNVDFQTQLTFHFSQIVTKQLFKFSTFHVLFLFSIQTSKWQQSRMSWQLKTVSNPNK